MQCVCITDPVLATQVLQSKVVDKLRFPYSFLDPVRLALYTHASPHSQPCVATAFTQRTHVARLPCTHPSTLRSS